ncbi:uncharacterized protein YnzC (UPF0291/DUF896 family) [Natranaerovirga pectinivora]|uniref:UPF0291 protein EDC18_101367 n=1 Tax=Natranaerovirga pectinivora TaxID=682400 RepID=A0A4R3MPB8_9FIRM|nr:DUF896 domain-containing protein [Natranaerovirga pectinivora]TCT17071.1 uncharacterized protein YnzC (UPF0291/DUF896 family) [Natranaerovirga pectinivora]
MEQHKIDRINELARKKKAEGLTEAEVQEQAVLREEYLSLIRGNFRSTMSTIKIKDEDGTIRPLKPKE